ncbi:protein FAR1-RELATED SEQUENCE 5-like [Phalaenopsis equestris]|uniref:protein FAR1-RELATED SEQUENCE 5-like n=1 Tax=Phalaenopsis equestris TaxID=78828 RepID=UPI0009E4AEB6|nr:protein FAR1-RELATED SEQUENCE 5-like [Phalaenopsis equestris]
MSDRLPGRSPLPPSVILEAHGLAYEVESTFTGELRLPASYRGRGEGRRKQKETGATAGIPPCWVPLKLDRDLPGSASTAADTRRLQLTVPLVRALTNSFRGDEHGGLVAAFMMEIDFSLNEELEHMDDEINVNAFETELSGPETYCNDPIARSFFNIIVCNEEEAYKHYCAYAYYVGFTVRKDRTTYWAKSKQIKSKDYICGKSGHKRESQLATTVKYRKADTRTSCQVMVRHAIDLDGNWTIKKFVESHNHPLAESGDKHLLRSNQRISELNANLLRSITGSGNRAVDAFNFLAIEVGGVKNLECTRQDAYNFIQMDKRSRIELGDVNSLLQLFTECQNEDNMFAWDFQSDEEGRLTSFFWSDGSCRLDYDCFGDVIIFDTSYHLNKYNLCCAPFVWINHHRQNVLFGVGFLSDEMIKSFKWLFKTFICIMDDKHPITMFTDRDQAMTRVIAYCFPFTRQIMSMTYL